MIVSLVARPIIRYIKGGGESERRHGYYMPWPPYCAVLSVESFPPSVRVWVPCVLSASGADPPFALRYNIYKIFVPL
jgi:hypothetical protein